MQHAYYVPIGLLLYHCHGTICNLLCLQEAAEASYVATMKTIRQVKTVFVIFIAFVCCWTPYIVVLLYDNSDSLPLPVHLYASMLAHLHASLNFAIYGLMNRNLRSGYAAHLLACCYRPSTSRSTAAAASTTAAVVPGSCSAQQMSGRRARCNRRGVDVSRSFVDVESHQLQQPGIYSSRNMQQNVRPHHSTSMLEPEYHSTVL